MQQNWVYGCRKRKWTTYELLVMETGIQQVYKLDEYNPTDGDMLRVDERAYLVSRKPCGYTHRFIATTGMANS